MLNLELVKDIDSRLVYHPTEVQWVLVRPVRFEPANDSRHKVLADSLRDGNFTFMFTCLDSVGEEFTVTRQKPLLHHGLIFPIRMSFASVSLLYN